MDIATQGGIMDAGELIFGQWATVTHVRHPSKLFYVDIGDIVTKGDTGSIVIVSKKWRCVFVWDVAECEQEIILTKLPYGTALDIVASRNTKK